MSADNRIVQRNYRIANILTAVVLLITIGVLCGWVWQVDLLKKFLISSVSIYPMTAFTVFIATVALRLVNHRLRLLQQTGFFLSGIILFIGSARIVEVLFLKNLDVSGWLFADKSLQDQFDGKPISMAPNAALCFVFSAFSFLFFHQRNRILDRCSDAFAVFIACISFGSIIGHLYHGHQLLNFNGYVPMALPTSICLFLLAFSILLYRTENGLLQVFAEPYVSSRIGRYVVLFAILLPVVLGLLRLYGEKAGWFPPLIGIAMFTMINVLILVTLIWTMVRWGNHAAREMELQKSKAMQYELMEAKFNRQKELTQATIDGQEKEKKQIGMELHDHINQILASTKLYLEIAKSNDSLQPLMLQKCSDQLTFAINEIRNLSKTLVLHDIGKNDIKDDLEEVIRDIERSTGIRIETNIRTASLRLLGRKEQVAVFRIVQEQLQNIVKHSGAKTATIQLWDENGHVQLLIYDSGKGFDMARQRNGIGLSNIASRVESISARMAMNSSPGNGCELNVSIKVHS